MGLIVDVVRAAVLAAIVSSPVAAQQEQAVPVTLGHASRQDVPIFARGIGTVQPFQSVLVRARVDGTLDSIAFTEGQEVAKGDLLASIDPRPYQATLDQALAKKAADTAQLANNKRDLARYADLARNDFASRQTVDTQTMSVAQTTANTQSDDAAITAAKLNLEFTRILSPISGRVGLRMVDPGNLIHANDVNGIVIINQIKPISVVFTLPQDMLPAVQDASRASTDQLPVFAFTSNDERQLSQGALLTVDNTIDTTTGTIRLKATFPNPGHTLWPGQFVNARLLLATDRNVVAAPAAAVQHGPNGLYVYKVEPGDTVSLQPIKVSRQEGDIYVVAEGLDAGAVVVTGGQSRLQNGARITINTPKPAPTAGSGT